VLKDIHPKKINNINKAKKRLEKQVFIVLNHTIYILILRHRPFNLKRGGGYDFLFRSEFFFRTTGGVCFFSKKNILIPNVAEKNILILVEEKQ
jgi:hypothetical protein